MAFDPNPYRKSVYVHPDGRDGAILAYARANNAVIQSGEVGDPETPGLIVVRTNRGRIWWSAPTGAYGEVPFA